MRQRLRDLTSPLAYRSFRLLWIAQVLSELGDWAARVALTILVFERTNSAGWAALVTAVGVLPWVGIGQVLSMFADRFSRRRVLVSCDIVRAGLFLTLMIPMPTLVLLALTFLAACLTPPFTATRLAMLPDTLPEGQYPDGIALANATVQMMTLVGLFAGGAIVAGIGARPALAVNAGSFVASAFVLSQIRRRRGVYTERGPHPTLGDGWHAVWDDPIIRWIGWMCVAACGLSAMAEAQAPVFAVSLLAKNGYTLGLLTAIIPLGTLIGALTRPANNKHRSIARTAAGLIAIGATLGLFGFSFDPSIGSATGAYFGIGLVFACTTITGSVFGQRLPVASRATAFSILQGFLFATQGLGAAIGGQISDHIGVRHACMIGAAGSLVVGLIGVAHVPRERRKISFTLDLSEPVSAPRRRNAS